GGREATVAWLTNAVALGAGATLHPREAEIRRLKLVAAPARSESEPGPGGHASTESLGRADPWIRVHLYAGRMTRRPLAVPLVDRFARRVRDLRISITDRCNLRCAYCMPAEGMAWLPRTEVLTYEEIARVARVCVERFGFEAIRLTGGEPLVRAHVIRLVEML